MIAYYIRYSVLMHMQDESEIRISGVVLKSGDEAFLKTITRDERDAGLFEKKIILGGRGYPVAVDTDGITAKLDDGEPYNLVTSSVLKNGGLGTEVLTALFVRRA